MTPQERQRVSDLFDRLAPLEATPRDPDAERLIADGLARAPNAAYALVQTVLVQDEALKHAEARIRELTGEDASPATGGFLDSARNALGGLSSGRSGATSVPSVRPAAPSEPDPRWNSGAALQDNAAPNNANPQAGQPAQPTPAAPGGSFLGTAAATAAGVIGGSLLFNSLGSLFGQHNSGSALAGTPPDASPWGSSAAGSDLARDAGLNDIGNANLSDASGGDSHSAGLFDAGSDDFDVSDGGDFGGDLGDSV